MVEAHRRGTPRLVREARLRRRTGSGWCSPGRPSIYNLDLGGCRFASFDVALNEPGVELAIQLHDLPRVVILAKVELGVGWSPLRHADQRPVALQPFQHHDHRLDAREDGLASYGVRTIARFDRRAGVFEDRTCVDARVDEMNRRRRTPAPR